MYSTENIQCLNIIFQIEMINENDELDMGCKYSYYYHLLVLIKRLQTSTGTHKQAIKILNDKRKRWEKSKEYVMCFNWYSM